MIQRSFDALVGSRGRTTELLDERWGMWQEYGMAGRAEVVVPGVPQQVMQYGNRGMDVFFLRPPDERCAEVVANPAPKPKAKKVSAKSRKRKNEVVHL